MKQNRAARRRNHTAEQPAGWVCGWWGRSRERVRDHLPHSAGGRPTPTVSTQGAEEGVLDVGTWVQIW